jgi:hypothetical protein
MDHLRGRRVAFYGEYGWLHAFVPGAAGSGEALIERHDGTVVSVPATEIVFCDRAIASRGRPAEPGTPPPPSRPAPANVLVSEWDMVPRPKGNG